MIKWFAGASVHGYCSWKTQPLSAPARECCKDGWDGKTWPTRPVVALQFQHPRECQILLLAPYSGRGWVRGLRVLASAAFERKDPSPCPLPEYGARGQSNSSRSSLVLDERVFDRLARAQQGGDQRELVEVQFADQPPARDQLTRVADGGVAPRGDHVEAADDLDEQLRPARVAGG